MDKRFIDRAILHKQYGRGVIINIVNDDITVEFGKKNMIFKFPDAFQDGTLLTSDSDLLSYIRRFVASVSPSSVPGRMQRFGAVPAVLLSAAWMEWYNGVTKDDIPINGGTYIDDHQDGNEANNFTPYPEEIDKTGVVKEWLFGSYETKSANGKTPNQTRIERIAGCQDLAQEGEADGVLVIWCATAPGGGRRVVGWYRDATVYRNYESETIEENDGSTWENWYNVLARAEDAVLLSVPERYKEKWSVPGHTCKGNTVFGFGQANVWYASEPAAEEYVKQLVKSINEYDGPTFLESYNERLDRLDDGTLAERPDYKGVSENRKQAIQHFRNEIFKSVNLKNFPRIEQVQCLQDFYNDKDPQNKLNDKQLLTAFLEAGANLIDDEGRIYAEQPKTLYEVKGLSFCCGHKLDYDEGKNSFTCSVCENEYEVTERSY